MVNPMKKFCLLIACALCGLISAEVQRFIPKKRHWGHGIRTTYQGRKALYKWSIWGERFAHQVSQARELCLPFGRLRRAELALSLVSSADAWYALTSGLYATYPLRQREEYLYLPRHLCPWWLWGAKWREDASARWGNTPWPLSLRQRFWEM